MFRKTIRLTLAAVTLLTLACSEGGVTGSTPASTTIGVTAPLNANLSLGLGLPILAKKLSCIIPDTIGVDIGPGGGTITLGGNSLVIPAGSLPKLTHILMLPLLDGSAGARFFPEGLVFNPKAKPTLTLNTDCIGNPANPYIVYTDDLGKIKEVLSTTAKTDHSVSAQIAHFSRYAVDW